MARKRKNRTHLKQPEAHQDTTPRSFIIKHGQVGASLAQLVRDVRKVMEPNTASRLKERSRNKLKDYLVLAPALHVSHLLAFTLTSIAPSLRIVRLSAGPTLSFRIERYSLMKDILNTRKRARSMGMEYLSPPLLVLSSFPSPSPDTPPHISLLTKTLQSLFPPLSPTDLSLSSARRIVLVHYNSDRGTIDIRHYLITVKPYGVSSRVRRILEGAAPKQASSTNGISKKILDLGNEKDVADFLLRKRGEPAPGGSDGYESAASSASSVAGDDADAISLADDYVGRNNKKGSKKAIRLDEIGPRMELKLVKIVEGVPGKEGAVLYHSLVKKSKKEVASLKASHEAKRKLKQARKEEQEHNVQRKKAESEEKSKKNKQSHGKGEEEEGESESDDDLLLPDEDADEYEDIDGGWDEDEEISDGDQDSDQGSDSDDNVDTRPPVKRRMLPKAKVTKASGGRKR